MAATESNRRPPGSSPANAAPMSYTKRHAIYRTETPAPMDSPSRTYGWRDSNAASAGVLLGVAGCDPGLDAHAPTTRRGSPLRSWRPDRHLRIAYAFTPNNIQATGWLLPAYTSRGSYPPSRRCGAPLDSARLFWVCPCASPLRTPEITLAATLPAWHKTNTSGAHLSTVRPLADYDKKFVLALAVLKTEVLPEQNIPRIHPKNPLLRPFPQRVPLIHQAERPPLFQVLNLSNQKNQ